MENRLSGVGVEVDARLVVAALCAAPALFGTAACNSFDEAPADVGGAHRIVPTDTRPVEHSDPPPPPISGGTLLVTKSELAVAADPERDRISVVNLATRQKLGDVELSAGDEPGRLVEDNQQRVHVALRGGGSVVTIDPFAQTELDRRRVCGAPRGIAYDDPTDMLYVACADGRLVTLPAAGGDPVRELELGPDLRDVVISGDRLWVSRFRSAELIEIDTEGQVVSSRVPPRLKTEFTIFIENEHFSDSKEVVETLEPAVAWRTLPLSADLGGTVMLHERGVVEEIDLNPPQGSAEGGSPYGDGSGVGGRCGSIVAPAVTLTDASGAVRTSPPIPNLALAVDAAISPDGARLAIANAGPKDPEAPETSIVFLPDDDGPRGISSAGFAPDGFGTGGVQLLNLPLNLSQEAGGEVDVSGQCAFTDFVPVNEQVVAVAFNPTQTSQLVAQTREPAQLIVLTGQALDARQVIDLGGDSRADTAHDIFHRDSGGGLACASCHPEGREDGRVWRFKDVGERRTQALNAGLSGTAPFHWDGTLPGVGSLMTEVFVRRMGGVLESPERLESLESWLFAREPLPPVRTDAEDPAVSRGKDLFLSSETQCSSCHSGDFFTNNTTVDVGTGRPMQVPSLLGVAHRAPYMHNGCAESLTDRFTKDCGGALHGSIDSLSDAEIADLVAYLESL